jgi:DNA-binding MarR family transcriptional regulator
MSGKGPRAKQPVALSRKELVEQVGIAVRKMGAQSVVTSKTVADRFAINQTDLEVLDLIFLRGQASAGALADATGLSSGSITALIDRLESAGYVERIDDPDDRRRVLVRVRHDAIEPIKATYMAMQKKMFALWSTFEPRELEVIADFIVRSTELAIACCQEIRAETDQLAGRSVRMLSRPQAASAARNSRGGRLRGSAK